MVPWPVPRPAAAFLSLAALAFVVASPVAAGETSPEAGSVAFRMDGEVRATLAVDALGTISPPARVRVFEPYEEREVAFEAVSLNAILDSVYGESWRTRDEVLLTCRDGYQPSFPVRRLLAYEAWIAIDRVDAERFSILKLERGERVLVDLSPAYLVWDNLDDPELRAQGDYGWPYQLVGIDLIDARARFPKMTPPPGSPARVEAGYSAFRMHCTRCHRINGEGGTIGPELNAPVNPTEYRTHSWLRQWIDDPASLVPTARMPRLNPRLRDRDAMIDDLIAYLAAMAEHKQRLPEASAEGS